MSDRDQKPRVQRGAVKRPDPGADPAGGRPGAPMVGTRAARSILYGWHTVTAALANPERQIRKLWLTENAARRLADDNIALPRDAGNRAARR